MKKIFLVLVLLVSVFVLFAADKLIEDRTYYIGSSICFSVAPKSPKEKDYKKEYLQTYKIGSILPYESGYKICLYPVTNKDKSPEKMEYFITNGTVFYMSCFIKQGKDDYGDYGKEVPCFGTVIDIKPNSFTLRFTEYKD